jgi:uncharacterized protein YndB with AHSA1/START domain
VFLNIVIGVGIAIVVLIAAVLIIAATKPDTFRIERSAGMKAPPERIFALINDFHNWSAWSPWEKLDPDLKRTFSGQPSGAGAIYEWEGNKKVGQGRMEIKESSPSRKVTIQLDFLKPFEAHNTAEFTLEPVGDLTNVNWAMHGRQPFMFKVVKLFINMEKLVGKDFETGLANLKAQTEK